MKKPTETTTTKPDLTKRKTTADATKGKCEQFVIFYEYAYTIINQ